MFSTLDNDVKHSHELCIVCGTRARTFMQHDVGHFYKCRCGLIFQDPREFISEHEALAGTDRCESDNAIGLEDEAENFQKAFSESIETSDDDGNMYADHGINHQQMVAGICDDLVESLTRNCNFDFDREFSLLDIGCATGFLLDSIQQRFPGAKVQGVEPSRLSAGKAKRLYGLDIHVGTMNTLPETHDPFDIVTILGNLQLHENPFRTLELACQVMKPDGFLVCQFKNPNCSARLMGRWATHVPVVRNFKMTRLILERGFACMRYSGNKRSLKAAVQGTGLEVIHVETIAPRMAKFSNMNQAHAKGIKGRIWNLLNWVDKRLDQQAWIQLICRKPVASKP